mmetsp:Transcript_48148/g.140314  ORF Transcript_48148/g.140314 Transcript_48148/m.140314 type:complete len:212 (-) Transcript_48148:649-1284(-)
MVLDVAGRVPIHEQPVAQNLRHDALVSLHNMRHGAEVPREKPQEVVLAQALRDGGEVFDVGEHDRHAAAKDVQVPGARVVAHDALDHGIGNELGEGLDGLGKSAERVLQIAHLLDPRPRAAAQLLELPGVAGEVEVAQFADEVCQYAEAPRDEEAQRHSDGDARHQRGHEDAHAREAGFVHVAIQVSADPLDLLTDVLLCDLPGATEGVRG